MPGAEAFRRRQPRGAQGSAVPQPGPDAAFDERRRRPGKPDEIALDSLEPDPFARLTLSLLRWQFQTFVAPESQGWLRALYCATAHVGPRAAGALCYDLVAVVQALRATRRSSFRFNAEGCACCRVWLTPDERRLVEMIGAVRAGRLGRARALGQILCDGNPTEDLIAMTEVYLNRHAPRASSGADEERPDPMVCRPQPG